MANFQRKDNHDVQFVEFCAEIAKNSVKPVTRNKLSVFFNKKHKLTSYPSHFARTFDRFFVETLLQQPYSLEIKAKTLFLTSAPILDPVFLEALNQIAHVELDEHFRIASFCSKKSDENGEQFKFEGRHRVVEKPGSRTERKRKRRTEGTSNGVEEEEEIDVEGDDDDDMEVTFSSLEPAPVQNYQSELNKIVAMQNNSTSQPMETSDISSPQYDSLYHFYRANSTQNDLLTAAAAEVLNPPSPKESKLGIVFSRPNYGDVTTSRHDVESPKNVVNNFVVTPIETPSTPVQYPPQAPFSDENYYAKFLKEMYCFLSDIDKNRFSKLKDLSRQAARLNKGMKLQPSTIKSYMEFCLDSLIVDKRVSHPTDKLLNSKKLLEELQETIEDMGPVMKYALHPILAEISPIIGNLDVVSKDSLEKSFENMIEQLQKRCDMNY